MMKHAFYKQTVVAIASLAMAGGLYAHCQIPCGIYGDERKFGDLLEHTETIRKSMEEITRLSGEEQSAQGNNQLVRWVVNKEEHAKKIQTEVADYFLAQRVKPGDEEYAEKLELLHGVIVAAMKCRQTVDLGNVDVLKQKIEAFQKLYMKGAEHSH